MKYAVRMDSGAKFHKDWLKHSKVDKGGDTQTHGQNGDRDLTTHAFPSCVASHKRTKGSPEMFTLRVCASFLTCYRSHFRTLRRVNMHHVLLVSEK
jgi:hypothetical protein